MTRRSSSPARVITSLNLKGGVGKTHLCWLTLGVCQEQQRKCLVLDLDKQGNITSTLCPNYGGRPGTEAIFNPAIDPEISELIQSSPLSHVDVIPGGFALERYNLTDPSQWDASGLQAALAEALRPVRPFYDYILLDCPADISLITYAALSASDFLMIPLEAAQWGALGTQHVMTTYRHVRENFHPGLELLGFVVSRFKRRRAYQKTYLQQLREHFGDDAFETVIPDLSHFEKSVNDRIPIVLHSPRSHASSIAREFFHELEARAERLERIRQSGRPRSVRVRVEPVA